ncbi:C45 family autoproteolytic acyltransferase/hydolase [Halorubrum luteum]
MAKVQKAMISGEPYEIGRQHGKKFTDEIKSNIDFYYDFFSKYGIDEGTANRQSKEFIDIVEETNSDYLKEMKGVAEGSGQSLSDIVLVNMRHTIIYSAYENDEISDPDGCSSFGVQPEKTVDDISLIGQNWDWKLPVESIVLDVRRPNKPNLLMLTEAGMVGGKFGLNEHGIGFVVNGLSTPKDGEDPFRKPSHVRSREILNANRLDQAVGAIIDSNRPTSRNYLVANGNGEMVDIETTPDNYDFLHPENSLITHTNHFVGENSFKSTLEQKKPHSVTRHIRMKRMFDNVDKDISISDIKSILSDHSGKPKSLCRHSRPELNDISYTNNSSIMDLTNKRMWITGGPPCENEYLEFEVNSGP